MPGSTRRQTIHAYISKSHHTLYSKEQNTLFSFCWSADWFTRGFDLYKLQAAEGEARVSLLQREVERLSQALLKAQEGESALREKTSVLKKSLQEAAASHGSTQGRVAALQKTLSAAEQDKRILQVSATEGGEKKGPRTMWREPGSDVMFALCR